MRLVPTSLRVRLTVLYVSLLTLKLILYAGWTSAFLLRNLFLELDSSLDRDINSVERLVSIEADGLVHIDADNDSGYLLEVWAEDGKLLYRSAELKDQSFGYVPALLALRRSPNTTIDLGDGQRVRIISRRHRVGTQMVLIRMGVNEEAAVWDEFKKMGYLLALGIPVAVSLVGITGYFVAGRALRPVGAMARRAEQINADNLKDRLAVENPRDELGQFGTAFNETLSRLERSFAQIKCFTADAAHEFRTPLTSMRSVGEVALQKRRDTHYYRDVIGSILEEVHHLTRLVDVLLTLSRADAGYSPIQRSEVRLLTLAQESAGLLAVLAEEKHQSIEVGGEQSLSVAGDRLILRQALVALIHNAVNYTPQAGHIRVWVRSEDSRAVIEVQDNGCGIAEAHRTKVFERFYRVDPARVREWGGAGLGLSIAKWAVEAHGGQIDLIDEPGPGCTFSVRLPLPVGTQG